MLAKLSERILPHAITQRLRFHRHEIIAAKQPSRWIEIAKEYNLDAFRSFAHANGVTYYTYNNLPIGEIKKREHKPPENTLSDFFNALRMVVAAYERVIAISDELHQTQAIKTNPIVVLQPIERKMLLGHPCFTAITAKQKVTFVSTGQTVYRIVVTPL